uniref:Uncharacterized protein n=1 Tax=Klebsiella pneumoniae TaxID=573 RepID=A0A7S5GG51_KLEPN|nr:hypothetical protein pKpnB199_00027 [Klebsiella pneumoniae]
MFKTQFLMSGKRKRFIGRDCNFWMIIKSCENLGGDKSVN